MLHIYIFFYSTSKKLIQLSQSKKFNDHLDKSTDTIELEIVVSIQQASQTYKDILHRKETFRGIEESWTVQASFSGEFCSGELRE